MDNLSNYKLFEMIGEGGFAVVHRAVRNSTNETVAIKIIDKSKLDNASILPEKIENEISIQQNLNNPHIVHCSNAFSDFDHIYVVLEMCNDGNLFDRLYDIKVERSGRSFNESESVYFLFQILSGLHYLHVRKVVHRDLKLSNILLHVNEQNGAPILKICDFGFSFIQEHPDQENMTICGTPNYFSPEMTTGVTPQSPALDIWAAGVIFYWLVTGSPPFNRPSKEARNGPPPDFDTKFVEPSSDILSEEGRDLLKSLLQKDPLKRPSARQALNHVVFAEFHSATTASTPHRTNTEEVSSLTHLSPVAQFTPQAVSLQQPMRTMQSAAHQTPQINHALNRRLEFDQTPQSQSQSRQNNQHQQNLQNNELGQHSTLPHMKVSEDPVLHNGGGAAKRKLLLGRQQTHNTNPNYQQQNTQYQQVTTPQHQHGILSADTVVTNRLSFNSHRAPVFSDQNVSSPHSASPRSLHKVVQQVHPDDEVDDEVNEEEEESIVEVPRTLSVRQSQQSSISSAQQQGSVISSVYKQSVENRSQGSHFSGSVRSSLHSQSTGLLSDNSKHSSVSGGSERQRLEQMREMHKQSPQQVTLTIPKQLYHHKQAQHTHSSNNESQVIEELQLRKSQLENELKLAHSNSNNNNNDSLRTSIEYHTKHTTQTHTSRNHIPRTHSQQQSHQQTQHNIHHDAADSPFKQVNNKYKTQSQYSTPQHYNNRQNEVEEPSSLRRSYNKVEEGRGDTSFTRGGSGVRSSGSSGSFEAERLKSLHTMLPPQPRIPTNNKIKSQYITSTNTTRTTHTSEHSASIAQITTQITELAHRLRPMNLITSHNEIVVLLFDNTTRTNNNTRQILYFHTTKHNHFSCLAVSLVDPTQTLLSAHKMQSTHKPSEITQTQSDIHTILKTPIITHHKQVNNTISHRLSIATNNANNTQNIQNININTERRELLQLHTNTSNNSNNTKNNINITSISYPSQNADFGWCGEVENNNNNNETKSEVWLTFEQLLSGNNTKNNNTKNNSANNTHNHNTLLLSRLFSILHEASLWEPRVALYYAPNSNTTSNTTSEEVSVAYIQSMLKSIQTKDSYVSPQDIHRLLHFKQSLSIDTSDGYNSHHINNNNNNKTNNTSNNTTHKPQNLSAKFTLMCNNPLPSKSVLIARWSEPDRTLIRYDLLSGDVLIHRSGGVSVDKQSEAQSKDSHISHDTTHSTEHKSENNSFIVTNNTDSVRWEGNINTLQSTYSTNNCHTDNKNNSAKSVIPESLLEYVRLAQSAASLCVKEAERGGGSRSGRKGPTSHRILTVAVL